jgi:hypothetical protein
MWKSDVALLGVSERRARHLGLSENIFASLLQADCAALQARRNQARDRPGKRQAPTQITATESPEQVRNRSGKNFPDPLRGGERKGKTKEKNEYGRRQVFNFAWCPLHKRGRQHARSKSQSHI